MRIGHIGPRFPSLMTPVVRSALAETEDYHFSDVKKYLMDLTRNINKIYSK